MSRLALRKSIDDFEIASMQMLERLEARYGKSDWAKQAAIDDIRADISEIYDAIDELVD